MRSHRGFTLVELLVTLTIMLTVTAGIYKLLNGTQRLSRAQAERVDLQSNVRTAALYIPSELRELNTVVGAGVGTQNDIIVAQPTTIQYRAMRGIGFVCQSTTTEIRVKKSTYVGARTPQGVPRDAVYVFVVGSSYALDSWVQRVPTAMNLASTCPDGTEAYSLTIPAMAAAPPVGMPVRFYEVMQLSTYVTGGKTWLGAQSISAGDANPQPVLGPLRATNGAVAGLEFKYYDGNGNETADLASIKSVRVRVWGETSQQVVKNGGSVAGGSYVQDSLVSQVSLRNSFRP